MDNEAFTKAYFDSSRNGVSQFFHNKWLPKLVYSDGVQECAATGCYWLLDIVGTEVISVMKDDDRLGLFRIVVNSDSTATMMLELEDDAPAAWTRFIEFTDMPEGVWSFYVQLNVQDDRSYRYVMILPTEY